MVISQIPVKFIFHSYSESSTFGRPGHGRSIPHQMAISQIPALTAHISWQLIFHSYSESSTFGRPGLGRSTPNQMAILPIPALLSKLIFSRPVVKWWFHRFLWNSYFIPTLRAQHLADQVMADLSPIKWQFHRFLLWQLTFHDSSYFIPTLRAQHLADQVLAYLPPIQWWFYRFLIYSESSTFGRPSCQMVISQIPALTAH